MRRSSSTCRHVLADHSATLGALAAQENDSSANILVLLTAGEQLPLPVAASSTLPANILHLDVLALEHRLLRRAQEKGIPGVSDRGQPLLSLGALLQILQIPVPPLAPLGNAGNDAYYTVLAFQKLMMAETRLPDLLFSQPTMPFPSFPSQSSMNFAQYPIPPFAQYNRRSSASPHRNPPETSSTRNSSSNRGERSRPVSFGDSKAAHSRPRTPEEVFSSITTSKPAMARSQTVYWDDADYAKSGHSREGSRTRESTLRPSIDARGGSGSRSISWNEEEKQLSGQSRSAMRHSSGPSGLHSRQDASSSSLNKEVLGSSSSTKIGSGSSSKKSQEDEVKLRQKKDEARPKSGSVRGVTGALARFWVG